MGNRCFVIMPYGKNESEKKEYGRLYKFLIKSAAEEMGLECVRSDIEDKGGHILSNVIEELAMAEIVVADLSDLNWNVAYELGMRHVLHRNGTILMCNSNFKDELPFDVKSLNIFFYQPDWIDNIEELGEQLKKAIDSRLTGKTKNDSPVHEKFSFLPDDIVRGFSDATDEALKRAKERIASLEKELSDTNEKIENMGLSLNGAEAEAVDYSEMFLTELSNSIYNSDVAVAKLRELLDQDDKEGFLKFLGKVLTVGFLDETDSRTVYILTKRLRVPAITRQFLEAVTKFYPENEELAGFLANEYSLNYHTGEKALQMVNGVIGVSKKDGNYILSKNTRLTVNKLGSLFDVYIHLSRYRDMAEIGELLVERVQGNDRLSAVVYRNLTSAYLNLDKLDKAKKYIDLTLEVAPLSTLTHSMCARYESAAENYERVVEEIETCIRLAVDDYDYFIRMAGYICDNQYARDPRDLVIKKVAPREVDRHAVPFLIYALSIDRSCINRVLDFLRRNKFAAYIQPIVDAYQSGVKDFRSAITSLDYSAVDFCLKEL